MSKKILVKLDIHDGRDKQKAIKAVAALIGIDAISVDLASKKMTVIGMVDPVKVVSKLRKAQYTATLVSIGPANPPPPPPEKKEEKKDEKKEGEGEKKDEKKDEKKEGEGEKKNEKKDGEKKDEKEEKKPTEQQIIAELLKQYQAYNPYMAPPPPPPPHYYVHSMEENPNSCVIC